MKIEERDLTEVEFGSLLRKSENIKLPKDLSSGIMDQIYLLEAQRTDTVNYQYRSWFFISLAAILSILSITSFSVIQATFELAINSILPGLYDYITLFIISTIAGLFFYQLNQLLSHRFRKVEIAS